MTADTKPNSQPASYRAPQAIFWTGFLIRVAYITLAHTYRIRLAQDHFQFGWEMGRIARALVTGYGYSDPFTGHTGPTAWCPPIYPLLIAAAFKLAGIYTPAAAWLLLTLNSLFSAAIAPLVYEIAARCYNRRAALWSAWLWALYPAAMQYAARWVWEMSLSTLLFTVVLVVALRLRRTGDAADGAQPHSTALWAVFGVVWGLIALLNSTLLLFLPVSALWILFSPGWRERGQIAPRLARAILAAVLCLGCIAPWIVRNALVFHAFIPIRGNFGAELYASLLEANNGFVWGPTVPLADHAPTYLLYKTLGEQAFVQHQDRLARAYLQTHRVLFLRLTLKRVYFFWFGVPHPIERSPWQEATRIFQYAFASLAGLLGLGLALRRRTPAAGLFAFTFLLLPLTYYVVIAEARFRHPLEPLITILAVYLFQSAARSRQTATSLPAPND